MASLVCFFFFYLILISDYFTAINGIFSDQSLTITSANRMEKTTHLHFYFHDILVGKNPISMRIVGPPKQAVDGFGTMFMIDDPLTEGSEPGSKVVGKAQGLYALASQHDLGLLMVMNFAFTDAVYNGSTLSILGRNHIMDTVREMPILGGSGVFRFARSYALAKTFKFDPKTGIAIVQYNVSVLHF